MIELRMIGQFKDTLRWTSLTGSEKIEERGWSFNQIQDSALNLITGRILGIDEATSGLFSDTNPIRFMAIGSGDSSWDADPNNVVKPVGQLALQSEFTRLALTADDCLFLDGQGAELSPQVLSPRFKFSKTLGANDANGDLREFGLFGGDADLTADSGIIFNWITHPLIQKDASLVIERVVDIQFSINRS